MPIMEKRWIDSHRLKAVDTQYPKQTEMIEYVRNVRKNGYNKLDDVSHFFFDCLLIKPLQETLASTIKQLCNNYERMSPVGKLYFILNSGGDMCSDAYYAKL